jgi:alpha-L-arabinofuranosidase
VSRLVTVRFTGADVTEATAHVLTGDDPAARNGLADPEHVVPQSSQLRGTAGTFDYEVPRRSVSVIVC